MAVIGLISFSCSQDETIVPDQMYDEGGIDVSKSDINNCDPITAYFKEHIGPTDYWYPFGELGKCGEYQGQYVGMDAKDLFEKYSLEYLQKSVGYTGQSTWGEYTTSTTWETKTGWHYLYVGKASSIKDFCFEPDEMIKQGVKIVQLIELLYRETQLSPCFNHQIVVLDFKLGDHIIIDPLGPTDPYYKCGYKIKIKYGYFCP